MKLRSIVFTRMKGKNNQWSLLGKDNSDIVFGDINLIVGKNASGKSQIMNALHQLARFFNYGRASQAFACSEIECNIQFEYNKQTVRYFLQINESQIFQEKIHIQNKVKLDRQKGKIWNLETNSFLHFELDKDISAVSKADKKQYPYLEWIHFWGKNLKFFRFGSLLGKDKTHNEDTNFKEDQIPILILLENSPETAKNKAQTLQDMNKLGYDLQAIALDTITIHDLPVGMGLKVTEQGVDIPQRDMSQGMFRVLSLLLQINQYLFKNIPTCILIDDLGEGLDHQRSKALVDLLLQKARHHHIQIILTSNDRFVMNKIPLENWLVVHKEDKKSIFYGYQNSKEIFEEYKYSGLSNFDFLATEFYLGGFEKEEL